MTAPGKPHDPVPGYYRMRLVSRGPWVPVRVWLEDGERDKAGELLSDQILRCRIGDRELPCDIKGKYYIFLENQRLERKDREIWEWLWPISRDDYELLLHSGRWAQVTPEISTTKQPAEEVDLTKAAPVF